VKVTVMKWKTLLSLCLAVMLIHYKYKLQTEVQTALLTYKLENGWKWKFQVYHTTWKIWAEPQINQNNHEAH
jgi:hypothetical protein